MSPTPRRLVAVLTLVCAAAANAQAPGIPGPGPPLPRGYSVVRVELTRVRRFTIDDRAWIPAAHADIAVGNSRNRLAASVVRYPSAGDPGDAALGGGVAFSRVIRETDSPAGLTWVTVGAGTAGLGPENLPGSRVYQVGLSVGRARRFTPPGIGEFLLTVTPRFVWVRMTDLPPGLDRSAERIGGSIALDWGSQGRVGALVALDVDWSSSPPASVKKLQAAFRFGGSYRFLLFPRAHPMPPEE